MNQSQGDSLLAEVDRLAGQDKYQAALDQVEKIQKTLSPAANPAEWTRVLIKRMQLQIGLHGYETAVRDLKAQTWPEDTTSRTALVLAYGHSLVTYAHQYSWEINKREKVESKDSVDLKAWTLEQIYAEARRGYESIWEKREALGTHSNRELGEVLQLNTYPEGIRSTLRDTLTYLYADLLTDTMGWLPEQKNELYRLDLKSLLEGRSGARTPGSSIHPLARASELLGDLERWHDKSGRPAAALEARLERTRQLHENFTEDPDRKLIQSNLAEALKKFRDQEWWAMGMGTLAEFIRLESSPDRLIRARKIVEEGHRTYPASTGGNYCLSIIQQIDEPRYSLEAMAGDSARRRSLLVTYRNITELTFRAYSLDFWKEVATRKEGFPFQVQVQGKPGEREKILKQKPDFEWTVPLEKTVDYQDHRQFVTPPMEKPGLYYIVASADKGFTEDNNRILGVAFIVSDLVIVRHESGRDGEVEIEVLSGETGAPVAGAEVLLYQYEWEKGYGLVETRKTDSKGLARFSESILDAIRAKLKGYGWAANYFVFARQGDQLALSRDAIYFRHRAKLETERASLIFTDRSIYRPMQKVFWKVIAYEGKAREGKLQTSPGAPLEVSLVDANGQVVETKPVTTNQHGTASGQFLIPSGRLLGDWMIRSSVSGNLSIKVEEYKRPTFEAKFLDVKDQFRLNKPVTLEGEARYYFGQPVTSGFVRWQVQRTPVYPWWWTLWGWIRSSGGATSQIVAGGRAELQSDGKFKIQFTPQADARLAKSRDEISYQYQVSADVLDEGGETRSVSANYRIGFVGVEATMSLPAKFLLEGQAGTVTVQRTNLAGGAAPGQASWQLVALKGPAEALMPADQPLPRSAPNEKPVLETPGDKQRPRWDTDYHLEGVLKLWADGEAKAKGAITHDASGAAKIELPALPAGAYRLKYETADSFGSKYEAAKEFVVAGAQARIALPALLLVEKDSVPVGERARVLVASGFRNQPMVLEVFRDGQSIERRELEAGKSPAILEFPIAEKDRGGFGLALSLVRDHQLVRLSDAVYVPWDNKELKVSFSTFRDRLRPGSDEKWTIKVTGPSGKDKAVAAAELLAYMYDRSLDAFAPHTPVSPLSLYPRLTAISDVSTSLTMAPVLYFASRGFHSPHGFNPPNPDQVQELARYGIGGPGRRSSRLGFSLKGAVRGKSADIEDRSDAMLAQAPESASMMAVGKTKSFSPEPRGLETPLPAAPAQKPVELRSDFSETAFWKPHLITGEDGSASIEFHVPDSVTSWSVWAHAITRDFASGSVSRETKAVKELMVRPYLPRFLREGDQAQLRLVVNNSSDKELQGAVQFDIIDPETQQSLLASFGVNSKDAAQLPFVAPAGGSTNVSIGITTPAKVGMIAFKVIAQAGNLSDGELRSIPVLPGRIHLAQSRFVTLKDRAQREMKFEDLLAGKDPTLINEQLVVTLDAQLFYSVLSALPYLVNYPYECTEQVLNRFVSTGILSSVYKQFPAIEKMAQELAKRTTRLETWNEKDPNRKLALEETPWVRESKGGEESADELANVLNPKIARAQQEESLSKLRKAQLPSGAFPWFPGGPPSSYMTAYILYGFSKAVEFGVDIPKDMVKRAWSYMHQYYVSELLQNSIKKDCCWEEVTLINYVLTNYPDSSWTGDLFSAAERKDMLKLSFKHWKQHSPYLKGLLALTLHRMKKPEEARLVWDSVMDSAKTSQDEGTHWMQEDRSWLWYNDTIESQAFAIRTLLELNPKDPKLDGLVLWLFLNKKLNHWKSTRATAEAIYSLTHYLKKTNQLGQPEEALVKIGSQEKKFSFQPDQYTGKKNQIVIPGDRIDPKADSVVKVSKETPGYLFASATWHFSTDRLPDKASGDFLGVTRAYFKRVNTGREIVLQPLKEGAALAKGDEVEVHLSLRSRHAMEYVHLRDPRPAGFEPADLVSRHKWEFGIFWYEEIRDSGTNFFFERLPHGEYTFKYRIRAATAGKFKASPATVQPMYAPEFTGYSSGSSIEIRD